MTRRSIRRRIGRTSTCCLLAAAVLAATPGGRAPLAQSLSLGTEEEVDPAAATTGDRHSELIDNLNDQEESFEHRLDRFQDRTQWVFERLEAYRQTRLGEDDQLTAQYDDLNPLDAPVQRRIIRTILSRSRETLLLLDQLEQALDARLDALLSASSLARQLKVSLESTRATIGDADLARAQATLVELRDTIDDLTARRQHLREARNELEDQLDEHRAALERARDALLETELAESDRLAAVDDAVVNAARTAESVTRQSTDLAEDLEAARRRQRRTAMKTAYGELVRETATLLTGTALSWPVRPDLGYHTIAPLQLTRATVPTLIRSAGLSEVMELARTAVWMARYSAQSAAIPAQVSDSEDALRPLRLALRRLEVTYRQRQSELDRERIESINLEVEKISMQMPTLRYRVELWEEQRADAAARESGGILNHQPSAFNAEDLSSLAGHTGFLVEDLSRLTKVVRVTWQLADIEVTPLKLVLLLLGLLASALLVRPVRRWLARPTPHVPLEAGVLVGLRLALLAAPASVFFLLTLATGLVPPNAGPLAWSLALVPPVALGAWGTARRLFPAAGTSYCSRGVARYLRLVVLVATIVVALLVLVVAAAPLLRYPEGASRSMLGLLIVVLMAGWVGVLARRGEVLGTLWGRVGGDADAEPAQPRTVGVIRRGVERLWFVLVLGPVVVGVVYLVGYRNLAVAVLVRGAAILAVILLGPWVHQRAHRLAQRILGYPEGGGTFDLDADRAVATYRWTAPFVTVLLVLLALGLVGSVWGYESNVLANIGTVLTLPLFQMGNSNITPLSVVLFAVTIVATILFTRWVLARLKENLYPLYDLTAGMRASIDTLTKYLLFAMGLILGLQVIGVGVGFLAVFAGVIGIGIGFGSQALASNFISGLLLQFTRPIAVGDMIEVGGLFGKVKSISSYATTVRTLDNISVIVPNADLMSSAVVNWSESRSGVRLKIEVGVAYGTDVQKVRELLLEASDHPKVLRRPAPSVQFTEFGDSSLNFRLLVWIRYPIDAVGVRSDLRYQINQIFAQHDIEIPFPQRDLHLRSSEAILELADQRGWEVVDDLDDGSGAPPAASPESGGDGEGSALS